MPSRGGQLQRRVICTDNQSFNSCPRVEGNRRFPSVSFRNSGFNSCPRVEGNAPGSINVSNLIAFQFMPSRGGQRLCFICPDVVKRVSIHALAWRATRRERATSSLLWFQFMPSRGGQHHADKDNADQYSFNSCPRVEGNPVLKIVFYDSSSFNSCPRVEGNLVRILISTVVSVSIHALAWRATDFVVVLHVQLISFNSCPRVEGNISDISGCLSINQFQFMPSRGGQQLTAIILSLLSSSFNSCPRVEGNVSGSV